LSALGLYFHTVRHLRPIQVVSRGWLKLRRPRPDLRAAPPLRALTGRYVEPIAPHPSLVAPDTFRFLNLERRCTRPEDWRPADVAALWTYNLHYFDDLNARDAAGRAAWHRALLQRWVAENPVGEGVGWQPYPVSRRIVSWVKATLCGRTLPAACVESLAVQARWLSQRLEYHLLGNHLLMNAKALLHAGLYFDGRKAGARAERGLAILRKQIREQVLADGAHFELSTMYHAAVLEDLLDIVNILRAYARPVPDDWLAAIARMRQWLRTMTHPDGGIAFFNDAAFGIAPTAAELEAYCARLGLPPVKDRPGTLAVLEPSGFVRASAGEACLICDCAAVGPDYLPAHAHADTLSFELSLGKQRLLVNSGTSRYGVDEERARQRGTAAHNTVVVDGQDSSEMWGGFRVARRARVSGRVAEHKGDVVVIEASHDGYRRLPGRNRHRRRWTLGPQSLQIEDQVLGRRRSAEAFFHVHPAVSARKDGLGRVLLEWSGGSATMTFENAAEVELRPGTWHPEFGVSLPNQRVVARFDAPALSTRIDWTVSG
jgi:uncharacterized heparinase superfamily protein